MSSHAVTKSSKGLHQGQEGQETGHSTKQKAEELWAILRLCAIVVKNTSVMYELYNLVLNLSDLSFPVDKMEH